MKTSRIDYRKYSGYIITMRKFLEEFVYPTMDICTESDLVKEGELQVSKMKLSEIETLNHWDLTDLDFPFIKRIPEEAVKKDDIFSGKVLLVESTGLKHVGRVICAYKRPFDLLYSQVDVIPYAADIKRLDRKKR